MRFCLILLSLSILYACNPVKQISRSAERDVLDLDALRTAHIGISVYEPATGKYIYNYQGDKYFVPASNIKIPTCYAVMKYLGDSLIGLRIAIPEEKWFRENAIIFKSTGDPVFLHKEFKNQKVFDLLYNYIAGSKMQPAYLVTLSDREDRWGNGWSWNDYEATYMAERNSFPIFGNVLEIQMNDSSQLLPKEIDPHVYQLNLFKTQSNYFDSILNNSIRIPSPGNIFSSRYKNAEIRRNIASNKFEVSFGNSRFTNMSIPFVTYGSSTTMAVLQDTFKRKFAIVDATPIKNRYAYSSGNGDLKFIHINEWMPVHSQPTDSLLKPMMHRSDNFYAEQSLLMVSNEVLGVMNDARIIDTILKTDFSDLPQKPRWADGSGLSRYNLFSPRDFVAILDKMHNEFGMERIKEIFPTGNEGTLNNYYKTESGFIYAKTGTLSGVVALSGFLYTKKNKLLVFSVLVNNHRTSSTEVRRAVEKFVKVLRQKY